MAARRVARIIGVTALLAGGSAVAAYVASTNPDLRTALSALSQSSSQTVNSQGIDLTNRSFGGEAGDLLATAREAGRRASSVRITGNAKVSHIAMKFDVSLVRGHGGSGSFAIDGGRLEAVYEPSAVYIKFDKGYAKKVRLPIALAGHWIKAPPTNPLVRQATVFSNYDEFIDRGIFAGDRALLGPRLTFDRSAVIALESPYEELFVSAKGIPYPLGMQPRGNPSSCLHFTRWGKATMRSAPQGPGVIELPA